MKRLVSYMKCLSCFENVCQAQKNVCRVQESFCRVQEMFVVLMKRLSCLGKRLHAQGTFVICRCLGIVLSRFENVCRAKETFVVLRKICHTYESLGRVQETFVVFRKRLCNDQEFNAFGRVLETLTKNVYLTLKTKTKNPLKVWLCSGNVCLVSRGNVFCAQETFVVFLKSLVVLRKRLSCLACEMIKNIYHTYETIVVFLKCLVVFRKRLSCF